QPTDGSGHTRYRAVCGQVEPSPEEGRRAGADDHSRRVSLVHQRVEDGPGRPLSVGVHLSAAIYTSYQDLGRVNRQLHPRMRRVLLPGAGERSVDGHGRMPGTPGCVLDRFEPKRGEDPSGAELVDLAAETPHLVDDGLHGPTDLGRP